MTGTTVARRGKCQVMEHRSCQVMTHIPYIYAAADFHWRGNKYAALQTSIILHFSRDQCNFFNA